MACVLQPELEHRLAWVEPSKLGEMIVGVAVFAKKLGLCLSEVEAC